MKFLVLFGLVAFVAAAPQPRVLFHEHFEDFMDTIIAEVGSEIDDLFNQYHEFEGFQATINYLTTQNFKELVYEFESLPEFKAVIEFLENDNIDIHFFIDRFNESIESITKLMKMIKKQLRATASGTDFTSFIQDSIDMFPEDKLAALFEEKKAEFEDFKTAVDNLNSDEWHSIFSALWESETLLAEVATLNENGIDVHALLHEIKAIFGQN